MVKETQSLINVNGVVPVISSHWAGVVPPTYEHKHKIDILACVFSCVFGLVYSQIHVCSLTSDTTEQS